MVTLPFLPLEVRDGERKVHRLFAIDLATHHIPAFTQPKRTNNGEFDYPLRDALGVSDLDEQHVQIIRLDDLGDLGLTGYLRDGLGIPEKDIEPDAERLDRLEGHIAVISSAAFVGAANISPKPPVSLVGAFAEPEAVSAPAALASSSATERTAPTPDPAPPTRDTGTLFRRIWIAICLLVIAYTIYFVFSSGTEL